MGVWADTFVAEAAAGLAALADPDRAVPMRAYMRDRFPFLGVPAPGQREVSRAAWAIAGRPPDEREVVAAVDALWAQPEREHRYVGCGLVRRFAPAASAGFVEPIGRWVADHPWWDTCDALARHGAGAVVRTHPGVRSTMDAWLAGDDLWLTRTALLHMGAWKADIDREWVFAACLARADHPDFFIRKAIGWILRDLAWVDADAVVAFVDGPGSVLSGLSKREALKNVPGRGAGDPVSVRPGDRMLIACEGGPSQSRLERFPPRLEIEEATGTYVLVDDGPPAEWRYLFVPRT